MDETLCGVGYVNENGEPEPESSERVSSLLQRADQLLADLDDTVYEGVPQHLADGTSDELDAYDTVIDRRLDEDDLDDDMLATLTTGRPSHPIVSAPAPYLHAPPMPVAAAPRRSFFGAIIDAFRRLFGRSPAPATTDEVDYDESSAWTYTVSDRRVAQARSRRATR